MPCLVIDATVTFMKEVTTATVHRQRMRMMRGRRHLCRPPQRRRRGTIDKKGERVAVAHSRRRHLRVIATRATHGGREEFDPGKGVLPATRRRHLRTSTLRLVVALARRLAILVREEAGGFLVRVAL